MAALLLEAAGGPPRGSAGRVSARFDLQARSRDFLRRGLVLSGAIHLALLFAFLNLRGGGDDVLIRSYDRATDIFRQPPPGVIELPPQVTGRVPSTAVDEGIFKPVPQPPKTEIPVDFKGFGLPLDGPFKKGPSGPPPGSGGGGANPPAVERVYFVGEVEVAPVEIEAPKPPYPEYAREVGLTDRVMAEVLVGADGTVKLVKIRSGIKMFGDSVQETLYRWRFRPAKVGGRPVPVWVEVPVNFTL